MTFVEDREPHPITSWARSSLRRPSAIATATVCAYFNMITRLADSLGWEVPSSDRLAGRAPAMLEGGYSFAAMRQR